MDFRKNKKTFSYLVGWVRLDESNLDCVLCRETERESMFLVYISYSYIYT